jgi:acyl-homoserine-lactone acylase
MIYAQAEDDFNRVELNYINAMGRLAEVEGEGEVWRDLRMKLFVDPPRCARSTPRAPRGCARSWTRGPTGSTTTSPRTRAVRPALLTRFEPWMALAFTEGASAATSRACRWRAGAVLRARRGAGAR